MSLPLSSASTPSSFPLAQSKTRRVVVVVGGSSRFRGMCREIGENLPALVLDCDLAAATLVKNWRPFAVILTRESLEFSSTALHALTREVGATLIKLGSEDAGEGELELLLRLALDQAEARRSKPPRSRSGRRRVR